MRSGRGLLALASVGALLCWSTASAGAGNGHGNGAGDGKGNSSTAHACAHGGYRSLVGADGTTFLNSMSVLAAWWRPVAVADSGGGG
jgi:hypothetical protein